MVDATSPTFKKWWKYNTQTLQLSSIFTLMSFPIYRTNTRTVEIIDIEKKAPIKHVHSRVKQFQIQMPHQIWLSDIIQVVVSNGYWEDIFKVLIKIIQVISVIPTFNAEEEIEKIKLFIFHWWIQHEELKNHLRIVEWRHSVAVTPVNLLTSLRRG